MLRFVGKNAGLGDLQEVLCKFWHVLLLVSLSNCRALLCIFCLSSLIDEDDIFIVHREGPSSCDNCRVLVAGLALILCQKTSWSTTDGIPGRGSSWRFLLNFLYQFCDVRSEMASWPSISSRTHAASTSFDLISSNAAKLLKFPYLYFSFWYDKKCL